MNSTPPPPLWTKASIALFIVLSITYFASHRELVSCNDGSQFALTRAIGEEFRFSINSFIQYTQRVDFSFYNGNFLSDRPPGLSLLLAPLVTLASQLTMLAGYYDASALELSAVLVCYIGLACLGALGAVVFLGILRSFNFSERAAWISTFIFAFASLHWKYATILMSHGPAETVLLLCVWLSVKGFHAEVPAKERTSSTLLLCFFLGLLPVIRLEAILFSGMFGTTILFGMYQKKIPLTITTKKDLATAILSGLTPLLFLACYHTVCFGAPWHTFAAYYHPDRNFWGELHSFTAIGGQFGVSEFMGHPLLWGIEKILFQFPGHPELLIPAKIGGLGAWGITVLQPVLFLAPFGFYFFYRKNQLLTVGSFLGFLAMLLFCASSKALDGGAMRDPRYIQPVLPLCFLLLAPVMDWWQKSSHAEWLRTGSWILCSALAYASFWMCFIHLAESDGSYYSFREAISFTSIYESLISQELLTTILAKVFVTSHHAAPLISVIITIIFCGYLSRYVASRLSHEMVALTLFCICVACVYRSVTAYLDHQHNIPLYSDTLAVSNIPVTRAVQERDWTLYATFTGAIQAPRQLTATQQIIRKYDLAHMTNSPLVTDAQQLEVLSSFRPTPCTEALLVKTRSHISIPINRRYNTFTVRAGRSNVLPSINNSVVRFQIRADNKVLFSSKGHRQETIPETISVAVSGFSTLELISYADTEGDFQYAVWCDAHLS